MTNLIKENQKGQFDPDNPAQVQAKAWLDMDNETRFTSAENVLVIQGAAGVGKTSFLHWIQETYENVITVAPTGIAAINARGTTIHSMFSLPVEIITRLSLRKRSLYERNKHALLAAEFIIIDEASMMRLDVLYGIETRLRAIAKAKLRKVPFGGKKIILFCDPMQLPPVVRSDDKEFYYSQYDFKWFFNYLPEATCISFEKGYRAASEDYRILMERMRFGETTIDDVDMINMAGCIKKSTSITLSHRNNKVQQINDYQIKILNASGKTYQAKYSGAYSLKNVLIPSLTLKAGCRVMTLINDPKRRFVNGSTGTVIDLNNSSAIVAFDNGQEVEITPFEVEQLDYKKNQYGEVESCVRGTMTQLPLKIAYAITIHKAQGLTLDSATIDLGKRGASYPSLTYVAFSRLRSIDSFYLPRPLGENDVFADPYALEWLKSNFVPSLDKEFQQRMDIENAKEV